MIRVDDACDAIQPASNERATPQGGPLDEAVGDGEGGRRRA
jgi:hypothetical protein